jgi:hypothetical protein
MCRRILPTQIYEFWHKILGHVLSGQTLLLFLFHLPAPPPYFIHTSKSESERERILRAGATAAKTRKLLSPRILPEIKFIIFYRHLVTIKYCNKKCQGSRTVRQTAEIYGRIALQLSSGRRRRRVLPTCRRTLICISHQSGPTYEVCKRSPADRRRPRALTPCRPTPTY